MQTEPFDLAGWGDAPAADRLSDLGRRGRFLFVALTQCETRWRPHFVLGSPGEIRDRPFRWPSLLLAVALFGALVVVGKGWL